MSEEDKKTLNIYVYNNNIYIYIYNKIIIIYITIYVRISCIEYIYIYICNIYI